jgi:hypothetical protein
VTDHVVLDPNICQGKPVVEKAGIATAILASSFQVNGEDAGVVADWYQPSGQIGVAESRHAIQVGMREEPVPDLHLRVRSRVGFHELGQFAGPSYGDGIATQPSGEDGMKWE